MINLNIVSESFSGGGAERVLANVANNWQAKHGVVRVCSLSQQKGYLAQDILCEVFDKSYVKNTKVNRVFNIWKVAFSLKANSSVLICSYILLILMSPICYFKKVKILFRPSIDLDYISQEIKRRFPGPLSWMIKAVLKLCLKKSYLIYQSPKIKKSFETNVRVDGRVMNNPVDADHFALPPFNRAVSSDNYEFYLIGRLVVEKGFDRFLTNWVHTEKDVVVKICGEGDQRRELQNIAQSREINVNFMGFTQSDALKVVNNILCVPSRIEGFPNIVLEGALAGWPIIISKEVAACLHGSELLKYCMVIDFDSAFDPNMLIDFMKKHHFDDYIDQVLQIRSEHSVSDFIENIKKIICEIKIS